MGPGATAGDLSSVVIEQDHLYIDFAQPAPLSEPGRLALAPQGAGYVGTMSMGQDRRPVALWPAEAAPDLRLWQEAAQGPEAGARTSAIAFTCAKPRCEVEIDGLGVTLEQGWSMTAPAWTGATAGAPPLDQPRVEFLGPDRRAPAAQSASLAG
ncbi:MAG: hypothetical protein ACU0A5_15990 [Salipiger marinus]|uniref:hypothetical protein n=1 Tax=Salipiger marinus TaxID=555512 RepID=UPI0040587F91